MQTKTINSNRSSGSRPVRGEPTPLLAGAAVAVGGVGAVLALFDLDSPLRAPFTLFFLLGAPAAAIAAALGRLDPLSRTVVAGAGALAVDMLVAQTMLSLHVWSARGGVVAVAAISGTLFLLASVVRRGASAPEARTD
ncbi:hypothetical protein [Streptomyces purpurogeneiscleroticus]|uniref:hypothetical protein n=1 Tax=Streptomyces purpurogeneiscleroticus TaxID=68259 RepID=UPI001CBB0E68|nr:hypothetical protein [Streptomyces purpurogeneiscleroticus]MBZ4017019.1 hypothetical protein [Streptomyces purpurogeneiscleroticus]